MLTASARRSAILKFLEDIWQDNGDGYMFIASRTRRGAFRQQCVKSIDDIELDLNCDLYFCPTRFKEPARQKKYAQKSRYLHVDLDSNVTGTKSIFQCGVLQPSIVTRTSERNHHLLWRLAQRLSPRIIEAHNKAVAKRYGGDDCHDICRYLRIPHTLNFKRDRPHSVSLVAYASEDALSLADMPQPVKLDTRGGKVRSSRSSPPMTYDEYLKFRKEYDLDTSLSHLVLREAHDRSVVLSGIIGKLIDEDVPVEKIWGVVKFSKAYKSRVSEKGRKVVDQDINRLMRKFR